MIRRTNAGSFPLVFHVKLRIDKILVVIIGNFFIGEYPGGLSSKIIETFDPPVVRTPFNDSVIFRRNGIDSVVINPLPPVLEGKTNVKWDANTYLDYSMLYNCHSSKDTIDTIDINDMREFTENVVLKILE